MAMACRLLPPPRLLPLHRPPTNAASDSSYSPSHSSSSSFPRLSYAVASVQPSSSSSSSSTRRNPGGSRSSSSSASTIRVVITEASSSVGRAAIAAVSKARGMAVAGAVDSSVSESVGEDAGELAGLREPLEVPVLNDLVLVLGSLSQSTTSGVLVDFSTDSARVEENVRQATAFGLKSVVCGGGIPGISGEILGLENVVGSLSTFCEKASTGCIVCPTLSIGRILLQQAATAAAFHYNSLQIMESRDPESFVSEDDSEDEPSASAPAPAGPSAEAVALAMSLSGFGRVYNKGRGAAEDEAAAAGVAVVGDGVRVQTSAMPGEPVEPGQGRSSMEVRLSGPGEVLSVKHDIDSVSALMPGLVLAIRRVVRLKSLIYGLEKIL